MPSVVGRSRSPVNSSQRNRGTHSWCVITIQTLTALPLPGMSHFIWRSNSKRLTFQLQLLYFSRFSPSVWYFCQPRPTKLVFDIFVDVFYQRFVFSWVVSLPVASAPEWYYEWNRHVRGSHALNTSRSPIGRSARQSNQSQSKYV